MLSSGDLHDGELLMVRYAGTECSILWHGMITNINNSNKRIKLIKHCDVICGVEIRFSEKLHIVIVKSGSIVILNTNAWADNILLQNKKSS